MYDYFLLAALIILITNQMFKTFECKVYVSSVPKHPLSSVSQSA